MDASRSEPRMVHILPQSTNQPSRSLTPDSQRSLQLPPIVPANSWIDQPTTQAGNARTRVFVACQTCRTRKIKCDGLKPVCTNCIKKDYAPGPDYQHLLPADERYKLQNGVCNYDPLPKRRGPDRLPGARVRRKSRHDDSGYERGSRHRAPTDSSESHQGDPSQELGDSVNVAIDNQSPEKSYLGSRIGAILPNLDSNERFMRASDPLRPYGNTLALDSTRPMATSPHAYQSGSQSYSTRDLSRVSPPDSTSSSDSTRSPVGLYTSNQDRTNGSISANETSIPTGYRPIQPTSEHFVPQVSRIARGRQENQSHTRSVAPRDSPSGYQATNPYYEYVPSAGAYIQSLEESEPEERPRRSPDGTTLSLPIVPGVDYVQKTWFDSLLDIYTTFEAPIDVRETYTNGSLIISSEGRHTAQTSIVADLRLLFTRSSYWFSFIHLPSFWTKFYSPQERASGGLQPGLVLAALAIGSFFRASEIEGGVWERERATRLRGEAEAAVDSSLAAGWIDIGLAQAAWFLAMYEICPHPYHTLQKVHSAMTRLDNIIRLLRCSSVDAGNPMVTRFDRMATPLLSPAHQRMMGLESQHGQFPAPNMYTEPTSSPTATLHSSNGHLEPIVPFYSPVSHPHANGNGIPPPPFAAHEPKKCICADLTLARDVPEWKRHVPLWWYTPRWPSPHTPGEVEREEARRIVWSCVLLMSSFSGHTATLGTDGDMDVYWTSRAENLALLYPGEAVHQQDPYYHISQTYDIKNTVWAIYCRAQLLWLACLRVRHSRNVPKEGSPSPTREGELGLYAKSTLKQSRRSSVSDSELAAFAMRAWLQTEEMETSLNKHTCELERAFIFQGREYLSSIRVVITQDFSRFVPFPNSGTSSHFNRLQADDWLKHQSVVVQRMMSGLNNVTGMKHSVLAYRPFFIWWFMIQVLRLLNLWSCDKSMVEAIQLSFAFLPVIDYLTAIWPCHNQRNKYLALRERLDDACRQCGIPPPPPPNLTVDSRHLPKNLV